MRLLPHALLWNRLDTTGSDFALVDPRTLRAHGQASAADPVPHACRYELATADGYATSQLVVEAEGAGWSRRVRLERSGREWQVSASEQGHLVGENQPGIEDPDRLYGVLDVDLQASALTNTLPIRRFSLLGAAPGTTHTLTMAWVLVPSLQVIPSQQTYTVNADGTIRYASDGFTADLAVDADGFVTHYPGYASLVAASIR